MKFLSDDIYIYLLIAVCTLNNFLFSDFAFEIQVRDSPTIVLVARTADEKNIWMGHFVSLLTRR